MNLDPERLRDARENLGINKAEAAKLLNMSAMGYGRYESGQRSPSYQTISFIAQAFNTSPEYLCGKTQDSHSDTITIDRNKDPELFELVSKMQDDEALTKRLLAYYSKLHK